MHKAITFFCFVCLIPFNLKANDNTDLLTLLQEIKNGRTLIQKTSVAFMLVSKQLVSESAEPGQKVSVTGNQESDRDISYETRLLAENFYRKISATLAETDQRISDFEKKYNALSPAEQKNALKFYEEMSREREFINHTRAYSSHVYQKLPPLQAIQSGKTVKTEKITFNGTAAVRLGSSVYESASRISETTRNISLAGNVIFNSLSRLSVQLNHNKDVIRTPYTSTDVGATYYHETSGGTTINTSVSFKDYDDVLTDRNSFRNVGAGISVKHPVNESIQIQGDVQAQSKKYYDAEDGNDLQGVQFNTFLDYSGKKALVNAGIRGRFQSGGKAFLDYSRIIPNIRVIFKTAQNSWSLYGEGEQMAYGTAGKANDFNRIRFDLETSNRGKRTQITAINKSYPNNERFNNLKIKVLAQKIQHSEGRNGRTTGYLEYTFHTSDSSVSGNYADLRFDRNFTKKTTYFDVGAFGRYWDDSGPAHLLSVYSRFGFRYSGFQIGPIIGADMIIDRDDPDLEQAGNSFRAGLDGRGNFSIRKASIYSSVRYQQTITYTGLNIEGESGSRLPATVEISGGAKIPVARMFEIQLDLRYYSLDFDYPQTDDPMPVQTQSGLRYLAGLSYRF